MADSREIHQHQQSPSETPTLQVDFQWKKFQTLITPVDNPSVPLYLVDFKCFKTESIVFKSMPSNEVIGTGILHPISIHADYKIRGQEGTLKALKHFKTSYTHISNTYSDNGTPTAMEWTSGCGFKTWDFICMDENQLPVAKFSSNVWAMKKIGNIEFLGPKASDPAFREEIVITGLTLFLCMMLRSTNILSLVGALFARTGPLDKDTAIESHQVAEKHNDHDGVTEVEQTVPTERGTAYA